jgi:hypothetical protein
MLFYQHSFLLLYPFLENPITILPITSTEQGHDIYLCTKLSKGH